jgi:hypothetical protein
MLNLEMGSLGLGIISELGIGRIGIRREEVKVVDGLLL